MQTGRKLCAFVLLLASLFAGIAAWTRPAIFQIASPRHQSVSASWTTEKWTGNEKPYVAARESIDADFSHGKVTVDYLSGLEAAVNRSEHDPLRLFRWAYARYKAQSLHPTLPFTPVPGWGAFDEISSPHTYQYARTRFLAEIMLGNRPDLMSLGKRLLAHNPNDFDVEYGLMACFHQNLSDNEKQAALTYADQLIQKYPTKPSVYAVKGGVYLSYWIDHRNKQDAVDAIKWYQRYLKLAPADYEWRKHAESTIALLQSRI